MKVQKTLNNNAIICVNDLNQEVIIMGKGIAHKQDLQEELSSNKNIKIFMAVDSQVKSRLEQLVKEIPMEHILISEKIINYGKQELKKSFNDNLYISLTDHINSSIERTLNGIDLKNPLYWDIKRLYNEEFKVGKSALKMISDELHVELNEDEAASIALHFVNAELNIDISTGMKMTKMIQEILNIVKYFFKMSLDEESLDYYRFMTHLRFFSQRVFQTNLHRGGDRDLLELVKIKYSESYQCTLKINTFIHNKYGYDLSLEELVFLTVHIARISNVNKN